MREAARLAALRKLALLDSVATESFDRITRLAAHIFGLPIAAISLTDQQRQWFKSRVGIEHDSIPRLRAPCSRVTELAQLVVIPDLLKDSFFHDSYLARSGVRFYAGAPLLTNDGFCLGAMCVLGVRPRSVSAAETMTLLDLAAMVMSQVELEHAVGRVDALSGLPNRNQLLDDLKDFQDAGVVPVAGRARVAVLLELATPQQASDALRLLGAASLDAMAQQAAGFLRATLAPAHKIYHIGPTQFVFCVQQDGALPYCDSLLRQWQLLIEKTAAPRFAASAAIGISPFVPGARDPLDLLRNLHRATLDAHDAADGVSQYSPRQDAAYRRRFTLLDEFGAAFDAPGQLSLSYQPRVDLASGACTGIETLLRWDHPILGAVTPDEFVPLMENSTLARAAGAWILQAAMAQLAAWRAVGWVRQLVVNVAPDNLLEPDFAARLIAGLSGQGVPAACLVLEISERALTEENGSAPATLAALAAAGVELLIGDVGSHCGSLSYLQSLPVKAVKIDRSFMQGIEDDERRRALVTAMIGLWRGLGYRIVAAGVDSAEVAAFLARAGCDEALGSLYGEPMPAARLDDWLKARPAAGGE